MTRSGTRLGYLLEHTLELGHGKCPTRSCFKLLGNWGWPKESSPLGRPQPHAPPALQYKSSGSSQALRYQMSAHVGKGSPTSDATSATSDGALNWVGDPPPEARPHSRLVRSGTGTGVLALRYVERGDSSTWMQPLSMTRSGIRPGSPPASPAICGRGCNLSYM